MNNDYTQKVDEYWSNYYKKKRTERVCWWRSPHIIRHVNQTICGKALDGWNAGLFDLLRQIIPENYIFPRALSIGCGLGKKEMALLEENLVEQFICFELSEESIRRGRETAIEKGLQNRITFIHGDFFQSTQRNEKYDMVFWDNSLHHMPDATMAVQVSYDVLNEGGIFLCHDFVGKSQFQWSDMELAIVNGIRLMLPEHVYTIGSQKISQIVPRYSIEQMNEIDPSEAIDSASILPAIQKTFTDPLIIQTGGLIYHLCLNGILINIPEDSTLLEYLLQLDDETIRMGIQYYAVAIAAK